MDFFLIKYTLPNTIFLKINAFISTDWQTNKNVGMFLYFWKFQTHWYKNVPLVESYKV